MIEREVGRPLALTPRDSGFEITQGWLDWRVFHLGFIALCLDVSVAAWFVKSGAAFDSMDTTTRLVVLAAVLGGVGLTYATLTHWFNTTWVRVEQDKLTVRHGPLPWFGNSDLDASDLKQVYVTENLRRGFLTPLAYTYDVYALTTSGASLRLLTSVADSDDAYLVELEIERYFHIENASVRGEAS